MNNIFARPHPSTHTHTDRVRTWPTPNYTHTQTYNKATRNNLRVLTLIQKPLQYTQVKHTRTHSNYVPLRRVISRKEKQTYIYVDSTFTWSTICALLALKVTSSGSQFIKSLPEPFSRLGVKVLQTAAGTYI